MWIQIGERIGGIRKNLKFSKVQFGKMIGVSGQHVGKIEKGMRISADLLINICYTTGTTSDYILFGARSAVWDTFISSTLQNLSLEQVEIVLDIIFKVAQFINTEDGNECLIREVASQQNMHLTSINQL